MPRNSGVVMDAKELGTPRKINIPGDDRTSSVINRNFDNVWILLKKIVKELDNQVADSIIIDEDGDLLIRVDGKNKKVKVES